MISINHRRHAKILVLSLCAGLATSTAVVWAQPQEKTGPVLKGPTVTERNVPGANPNFGMGGRRGERVPPEAFRRALAVVMGEDALPELRATREQREEIRKLVDGFEESVRKYRREHAKEIAQLREAAGEPARGNGRGSNTDTPMKDEDLSPEQQKERETARAKLRELQGGAPKIEDVYTKVWTELSESQRVAVEKNLDEWRTEQAKKREDAYVERQTAQRDKDGKIVRPNVQAARPAAGAPASNDGMMQMAPKEEAKEAATEKPRRAAKQGGSKEGESAENSRRERLVRLFGQLTAEEQEQLLKRLEERARERRRPNAAATSDKSKPPADVDQVKVPAPQEEMD